MNNLPKMTGIYPNKNSIAVEFTYNGVRCRETVRGLPTKTLITKLAQKRQRILSEIDTGEFNYAKHFPNSKRAKKFATNKSDLITVGELVIDWFERKRAQKGRRQLSHSTLKGYWCIIKAHLLPKFDSMPLSGLTVTVINDWIEDLDGSGLSPKRINNIISPLRATITRAYNSELIERNPFERIETQQLEKFEAEPFTEGEIEKILNAIEVESDRNLIEFAFFTGLRTSEFIALTWDDIDWQTSTISVNKARVYNKEKGTKTATSNRKHELHPRALIALERQQSLNLNMKTIFPDTKNSSPWKDSSFIRKRIWVKALHIAQVKYRNCYQMRHTYASQMLSIGKIELWVAKQLGHNSVEMIRKTYGKWMEQ